MKKRIAKKIAAAMFRGEWRDWKSSTKRTAAAKTGCTYVAVRTMIALRRVLPRD